MQDPLKKTNLSQDVSALIGKGRTKSRERASLSQSIDLERSMNTMNNDSIDSRIADLNKENFKKLSPRAHENNRFKTCYY